ncbi:Uncharacterised protein [Salmonella enterica subsp. arizonae]|nr:Uncharacterised protein [Salmonella enterica subsp. arizonae]
MNTNGAIDFTARAEQIAEGKMSLNGASILFKHIKEQVHRFILLVTQQKVNPAT